MMVKVYGRYRPIIRLEELLCRRDRVARFQVLEVREVDLQGCIVELVIRIIRRACFLSPYPHPHITNPVTDLLVRSGIGDFLVKFTGKIEDLLCGVVFRISVVVRNEFELTRRRAIYFIHEDKVRIECIAEPAVVVAVPVRQHEGDMRITIIPHEVLFQPGLHLIKKFAFAAVYQYAALFVVVDKYGVAPSVFIGALREAWKVDM